MIAICNQFSGSPFYLIVQTKVTLIRKNDDKMPFIG